MVSSTIFLFLVKIYMKDILTSITNKPTPSSPPGRGQLRFLKEGIVPSWEGRGVGKKLYLSIAPLVGGYAAIR
jgi:hypothetical protein